MEEGYKLEAIIQCDNSEVEAEVGCYEKVEGTLLLVLGGCGKLPWQKHNDWNKVSS